jgi:hypothetical protein
MNSILSAEYDAIAIAITDQGWFMNERLIADYLTRAEEQGAPSNLVAMCREAHLPTVVRERALALVARNTTEDARVSQRQLALAG